jgi:hypothetical protein
MIEDELRFTIEESELCSMCHSADGLSPGDQVHHSQASMLFGTDGYEYPGESYSNSIHAIAGPIVEGGCPTCHMVKRSVAGETGHGFTPSLRSCTPCHGRLQSFNIGQVQDEIQSLLDQLEALLESAQGGTDSYDRAQYNYEFVLRDGSLGVHNYEYAKKLLEDSIDDAPYDN